MVTRWITPSALLDHLEDSVIVVGLDHRVRLWSKGAERIYGWTEAEALGRPIYELLQAMTAEQFEANIARVRTEGTISVDGPRVRKDGRRIWSHVRMRLLREPDGTPSGILGVSKDATDLHDAQRSLEASEARLAAVLEGSQDGYFEFTAGTRASFLSPSMVRLLGEDPAAFPQSMDAWIARMHPGDLEALRPEMAAVAAGEREAFDVEYRIRDRGGLWRWMHARAKVVPGSAGGLRIAGTVRDVTARHEAHDRNVKLVAELKEALERVKTLSGLLPICMYCKKVRGDQGYWERIEAYVEAHTQAEFSHGMCPDCAARHFPGG